jgi:hypothetical protein
MRTFSPYTPKFANPQRMTKQRPPRTGKQRKNCDLLFLNGARSRALADAQAAAQDEVCGCGSSIR